MLESTHPFVTFERRGAVQVLWIDSPPVNALGFDVRAGLAKGLSVALADPGVRAVAILACGSTFPAGADISEFDQPPQAPMLPDLCVMIENSSKPVVVGLHGTALGGGLELALAAHARVGLADLRLGLPEVGLGILPGAGGTQRLPRLIGAKEALRLMITGTPIRAVEALAMGILDKVVEQDLAEATVAMALHLAPVTPVPTRDRRDGLRDPRAYIAAIAEARRANAAAPIPGPGRIIDCVEAAQLLPFDQGLAFESAAFAELVASPEAEALRHVFFAERRAAKMVGARAKPLRIAQITVLGAGADGVALIQELLAAGYEVTLVDINADVLTAGLEAIATRLAAGLEAGKITQTEHDDRWARLLAALPEDEGDAADILFLTGAFRQPEADVPMVAVKAGAPIVTMGRVGEGGIRGLGLVLLPATRNGRLAEVLIADDTGPETISTLIVLLKRMGRYVVQGQGSGITQGLAVALQASLQSLEDQHGPEPVLNLLERWGMPRAQDRSAPKSQGAKQGAAADLWAGLAMPVMGALANAGLRLVGEGKALRPSDVDLAMVVGLGFPRWGGGPMLWAQRRGLLVLRDNLNRWANDAPDVWAPAPLLDDMIRQGISLADLNDA
ncbi:enoyl-CoA hydratase-related protein [Pseudorhodobacter wandonensis]|uniref:enoyl-CoA hydratase-related protein n=1 Tax=Pseudorhodobacter wandonensis TaxID=1120568 RepID=UPI00067B9DE5|nr:enoyl-CoA hydratase-related protein [Pseudorhodobacter wandonensis]